MSPKVRLEHVSKVFNAPRTGKETIALQDVNLDIRPGEVVSLVGPSGCGKTTILNLVAGFDTPTDGLVLVDSRKVAGPGADRGVVFQEPALFHWLSVEENITFGPRMRADPRDEYISLAREMVSRVGLTSFEQHYPDALSGGMKQRVSIARILINKPQVLLLDEPFAALDAQTRLIMQEWLLDVLLHQQTAALFITHDIDEAVFMADRSYVMGVRPGRITREVDIPLPRPRSRQVLTSPKFNEIKAVILEAISLESARAFENWLQT